jgi:two-component system cell cycle response regulator DivK
MTSKTILIVEDNPVNQKLFLTVLRPHGYRLLTASDGEEALRVAREALPDLILMDLQLPKINGFAVTEQLRRDPQTAAICVVAVTAHTLPEERAQAEEAGFCAFITKPIDTREFPAQVREILDGAGRGAARGADCGAGCGAGCE